MNRSAALCVFATCCNQTLHHIYLSSPSYFDYDYFRIEILHLFDGLKIIAFSLIFEKKIRSIFKNTVILIYITNTVELRVDESHVALTKSLNGNSIDIFFKVENLRIVQSSVLITIF